MLPWVVIFQCAVGSTHQAPEASTSLLSSHEQTAPLGSAQGSGASPFSHASAQAAFSANLDAAMPSLPPAGPTAPDKPIASPHDHVTHMPFGPAADSPFEHPERPEEGPGLHANGQSVNTGLSVAQSSSRSGIDAAGSGLNPSDAQVRNSLTAASQPLPPESTAEIDAGVVDERHMTMSSGAALEEAMQSENANLVSQGTESLDRQDVSVASDASPPVAADMFSGLDVESSGQTHGK